MKVEHTAIYVNDLERAKDFFVRYFGGRANDCYVNETKGFSSYFIQFDDSSRLEIMKRTDIKEPRSNESLGFAHIAFSVGHRETVIALTSRLERDGYQVVSGPRTTGDGYFESCIQDEEGNLIEITV